MNNKTLKSFKDLIVWQKSVDLAVLVYKTTEIFPRSELYGIVNQMRRSSISISSNIAEGFKRIHKKEKLQFYNVAYGSAAELESQIEVADKLGFFSKENYQNLLSLIIEVSKMIEGLMKSLNSKFYILNSRNNGQAALPMVLIIGGVLFEIAVGLTFIVFLLLNSGLGERLSAEALGVAQAGLADAFIKIARDKNFSSAGFTVPIDNRTATVTVVRDVSNLAFERKTVTSIGSAGARQKKLQAVLVIVSNSGKIDLESVNEIAF
ncbi:MAG: four helix bundle protein [Candidatus Brennerbacteria bacterium]|nr:four helix bundle protein [Candidatus Brennerbacteria bacterium]